MAIFVVHYSEIALKGRNRPKFVRRLSTNIMRMSDSNVRVERVQGRLIVEGNEEVTHVLERTFGIAWFAKVTRVPLEYDLIEKEAVDIALKRKNDSFCVITTRANKKFQINSMRLSSMIGKTISERTGMKVRLKDPSLKIYIEILDNFALLYTEKIRGLGGLPVGVSGRVIHLLSGGIDSPVASYMMMKRGCFPIHLHFHPYARNEDVLGTKITELIKIISSFGGGNVCVVTPFLEYQLSTIHLGDKLEPVLFRYFMRLFAERLAKEMGAYGISTGDSLSQAASQTIWNIRAMDYGSLYPIFRPLLSMDKQEIVDLAKSIGTYNVSISDYKDCCSILAKHPQTRVDIDNLIETIRKLNINSLVDRCLSLSSIIIYRRKTQEFKQISMNDFLTLRKRKLSHPQAHTS
jgi:thiamine biosynthesis protein ThiI